jgi:CBS domain containing-hemolysin-like protein
MIVLLLIMLACVLACYFSACHAVLKIYSRKRLTDLLQEAGKPQRLAIVTESLPQLLLMTGLWRALCSVAIVLLTLYWAAQISTVLAGEVFWQYATAFGISLVLLGIFNTAIPVSWARYRNELLLVWSLPILKALLIVTYPIVALLSLFDPVVRRISGIDLRDDDEDLSDQVIAAVEDHEEGASVDPEQKQMIEAIFELRDTHAGEIMTPRTDVDGIDIAATLEQVKASVLEYGHSRVPVYGENLDDILGVLYAKDLIELIDEKEPVAAGFNLKSLLREPFLVPESKPVLDLLREFKATKVHLAIVLDEYGGTAGLITIEDILEEIVGDIQDEHEAEDDEPPTIEQVDADTAKVDARVYIDDLNDQFDLDLPEDEDYETVGGFVFANLGHIPDAGESFEAHGVKVTVDEAERTKVIGVTVKRLESAKATAESSS